MESSEDEQGAEILSEVWVAASVEYADEFSS
jgi:hypothetical protein